MSYIGKKEVWDLTKNIREEMNALHGTLGTDAMRRWEFLRGQLNLLAILFPKEVKLTDEEKA